MRYILSCLASLALLLLPLEATLAQPLTSLDLTNTATVSTIKAMQNQGLLGGSLKVTGGIATGGTLVLYRTNVASSITAADIPANVAVTFIGFSSRNPLTVSLTGTSTKTNVQVDGQATFLGSMPVMSIQNTAGTNALVVSSTGILSSVTGLTVNAAGNVQLGGHVGSNNLVLTTTSNGQGNGSVALAGTIGSLFGASTFNLNGGGSLTQTSGVLQGGNVKLNATGGSFGVSGGALSTSISRFTVDTTGTGTVFLTDNRSATIVDASSAGNFSLTDAGSVRADSVTSTGGSISVISGNVLRVDNVDAENGSVTLESNNLTAGQIFTDPGASISATSTGATVPNITIAITNGTPPQTNTTAPDFVHVTGTSHVFFGTNSIYSLPSTTITANGGTVTFSTGNLPRQSIFLAPGTTITTSTGQGAAYHGEGLNAEEMIVDTSDDGDDSGEQLTAYASN